MALFRKCLFSGGKLFVVSRQCLRSNFTGTGFSYQFDGWYTPPARNVKPFKSDTTAIVCGWAAARPKHVKRYTDIYSEELGIGAHGYTMPMELFFSAGHAGQRRVAEDLVRFLETKNSGKNILIHSFSNNGFAFYIHLSQVLKALDPKFKILGCITDSGPGPNSYQPYIAQMIGMNSNKHSPSFTLPLFMPATYFYFLLTEHKESIGVAFHKTKALWREFVKNWPYYEDKFHFPGVHMLQEEEAWPLLFLYSTKDDLMCYTFVEKVIQAQKELNPDRLILSHNFVTSGHVAHSKNHYKEYWSLVRDFVNKV